MKKADSNDDLTNFPLLKSALTARRELMINFNDFPKFSDFLRMLISAYGHKAELMEAMNIQSLSDFSQRLNGDPHDPNKITFKDKHIDSFLKKSNWYGYFREWFEYQEKKNSKAENQEKAELADEMIAALIPILMKRLKEGK